MTHIVAIQQRARCSTINQQPIQLIRDRALAAPAQPSEPNHNTALPQFAFAVFTRNCVGVPNNVLLHIVLAVAGFWCAAGGGVVRVGLAHVFD